MSGDRNFSGVKEQTKSELLERRILLFTVEVIKTLKQKATLPKSVADQLTRSAASIGANYAEACNASSKADFRNKIFIAKKEAAESRYWIDLCIELSGEESWLPIRQEAHELLMILQTIINSLLRKSEK